MGQARDVMWGSQGGTYLLDVTLCSAVDKHHLANAWCMFSSKDEGNYGSSATSVPIHQTARRPILYDRNLEIKCTLMRN
jgi:hypothetical protein